VIPDSITADHVRAALTEIRRLGVPPSREADKWSLIDRGQEFPPKYVISVAGRYATGTDWPPDRFSGGPETNDFLSDLGFPIAKRSTDWSEAECYFAVWAYDQIDADRALSKTAICEQVARIIGRTAKAVEYKLQNVAFYDARPFAEKPIATAKHAQALLQEVFESYWKDREAGRRLYPQYRTQFEFAAANGQGPLPDYLYDEASLEAASGQRRTRSAELVKHARRHFAAADSNGLLRCAACGFAKPHDCDHEIVQIHHTEPIADAASSGRRFAWRDVVQKLLPLCPTCHAIAHTSRPPRGLDGIKLMLQSCRADVAS
jgi:predicted HNH restriction endonuclease